MRVFTALLFAASTLAYQVTYPTETQGWTTSGSNTLSWDRVDTDPLTFAAVLINQNIQYVEILDSSVDGTAGSINLNAPSGGWPTGSDFRVNLARDAQNLDALLAQSPQFDITGSASSGTSSGTSSSTSSGSTRTSSSTTSTGTTTSTRSTTTSTSSGASSTSSSTSTTPTSTSAGFPSADARAGLLTAVVALTTLVTILF